MKKEVEPSHTVHVRKYSMLDGKTAVEFVLDGGRLVVRASKMGLELFQQTQDSPTAPFWIAGSAELNEFAKVIGDAFTQHRKLMVQVESPTLEDIADANAKKIY